MPPEPDARAPGTRPIAEVAEALGIRAGEWRPYGDDVAKLDPALLDTPRRRSAAPRLVLVSAITPTAAGEGKTTTSIGLAQGLARLGESVCLALREPSLGPVFGMKGGGTGAGQSQLVPSTRINLHFTGDFHAITSAHNLLAALLDNHLYWGNSLRIDPRRVLWKRVIDMNDRALRNVIVGLGGPGQGVPRETGFDITAASEVMALLCLARDEDDLRARIERLLVAFTEDGAPVTATDLGAAGAMLALLRDALWPNLVQTIEGVPALVHGGPFANIAHGCNSAIATRTGAALRRLDDHRGRLRLRPRRREVLRHQVPQRRARSRRGGAGGDGARAQAPRRRGGRRAREARRRCRVRAGFRTSTSTSRTSAASASGRWWR